MTKRILFFSFSFVFLGVYSASAYFPMGKPYSSGNKGRGWFWYQIQPKKRTVKKNVLPKKPDLKAIAALPVKAYKKLLKEYKYAMINNPTERNVQNYIEVQEIAEKKAVAVSYMWKYVMESHPSLNYTNQIGGTSKYNGLISSMITHNKEVILAKSLRNKMGLILFYDPSDPETPQEVLQLSMVARRWGFYYRKASVTNHPNTAKRMGVIKTPEIIMVYRKKDGKIVHYPVAVGLRTQQYIKDKIFYVYYAFIKGYINGTDKKPGF